jgi:phosphoribosylformylglycinamidine synthase
MMRAHMTFHPAYVAKPFALGGAIGTIPAELARRGRPLPGDLLMLIGGLTGNDGIHGASASSAGAQMDEAAVQIGSPLEQVKFRQAIVDLRDTGCLRALTDVGGAGLNSAVGEIGDPGGVWINTALVPLKTAGLPTWRILLSESQERMILTLVPEKLERARTILERHGVRHTVVGRFTSDGRFTVVHRPGLGEDEVVAGDPDELPLTCHETGFSVPYELLEYEPPQLEPPARPPAVGGEGAWPRVAYPAIGELAPRLMADPEIASQRFAGAQYDTTVQGLTEYGPTVGRRHVPTSFWAGTPLPGSPAAVVFTTAFNPWLFELDPVLALRQMFLRALLKQVLAGVKPHDVCLCDNFYTPHLEPGADGWLVGMVDELVSLVDHFGTPVISGKDSSAGSVVTPEGIVSVPPAAFLSAVGKVPDAARLRRNEWTAAGNLLVRIGPDCVSPGGTVAGRLLELGTAELDAIELERYVRFLNVLADVDDGLLLSGRPIGKGGTLATLALGAYASAGLGAEITLPDDGEAGWLLREHRCGALVEVEPAKLADLPPVLRPRVIGRVTEDAESVRLGDVEVARTAVDGWADSWAELLR